MGEEEGERGDKHANENFTSLLEDTQSSVSIFQIAIKKYYSISNVFALKLKCFIFCFLCADQIENAKSTSITATSANTVG